MAVTVGELVATLGADIRDFQRKMDRASRTMRDVGQSMTEVGARLTTRVALPLLGIGAAATKATADWETAMTGVAKTVDAPAAQINALGDIFVGMSEQIPVAADALARIGEEAGQLGVALRNIPEFAETVAALRVSTNLADRAGTTLARMANIMGTAQTEFDRMGSTIVDLGNNLATTEAEIAEFALRIAGAGRVAGLAESDVLAIGGALSSVGIQAEAGGTAVQKALIAMNTAVAQGSDEVATFARVAGQSVEDFTATFETEPIEAFTRFIEGLRAQGDNATVVLEELFDRNQRLTRSFLALSGAGDLLRDAVARGSEAWEENTALATEAGNFYDRLAATFTRLRNKAGNIAAELGDALRPAIDRVTDLADRLLNVARGLIRRFAALAPQTRIQAVAIAGIAAAIGPALIALGALLKGLGLAVVGVRAFTVTWTVMVAAVRLLPKVLNPTALAVIAAVGAIAAVVLALRDRWGDMAAFAVRAWGTIAEVAPRVLRTVASVAKGVVNGLIGALRFVGEVAVIVFDEFIRGPAVAAFGAIRDWAKPVLTAVARGFEMLGKIGADAANKIRGFFVDAAEGGDEAGATLGSRIAQAAVDAFGTDYVGAFLDVVRDAVERARAFIAAAIGRLREMGGGGQLAADLERARQALAGVGAEIEGVQAGLDDVGGEGVAGIEEMGDAARIAESSLSALVSSLISGAASVGDAFKRMVQTILDELARLAIAKGIAAIFNPAGAAFGGAGLVQAFAHGGPFAAGMPMMVGERGPEMVQFDRPGRVVRNEDMQDTPLQANVNLRVDPLDIFRLAIDPTWQTLHRETSSRAAEQGA